MLRGAETWGRGCQVGLSVNLAQQMVAQPRNAYKRRTLREVFHRARVSPLSVRSGGAALPSGGLCGGWAHPGTLGPPPCQASQLGALHCI